MHPGQGPSWGGFEALARTRHPSKAAGAAASVIILALAVAARWQVSYWQDRSSIWSHTLEVTTDNLWAELSLGTLLSDSGRLPEAVGHLTRAVSIRPDSFDARINLGLALMRQHRFADAVPQDRIAVQLQPDSSLAHSNLGLALIRTGPAEEAARELREALRLDANNREAQQGLDHLARARR